MSEEAAQLSALKYIIVRTIEEKFMQLSIFFLTVVQAVTLYCGAEAIVSEK
jgi:hypothetical protein